MTREAKSMELSLFEMNPLVPIRNETVLTHYPIHRLGKHGGGITFEILEKSETEQGKHSIKWQVSYNSKYGEPGPLAYKIDTIIINRAIDEAREQGLVPSLIKLGSLSEIARELGTGDNNTSAVKQALYQNAFAAIVTTQIYVGRDGTKNKLEFAGTRYALIFAGQDLPDGHKADAVYIRLQEDFHNLLNSARTRPLDYNYLKELTPGPQRLYELLSFEIYAALKRQTSSRAKLVYSEYCLHAPQKRYFQGNRMRMQMKELHAPHIASGYITDDVEYVETTDDEGNIDWEIFYTPGRKATAEFVQFNSKGSWIEGRKPDPLLGKSGRQAIAPPSQQLALPEASLEEVPDPEREAIVAELIEHGLAPHRAYEAVREKELEVVRQAIRLFKHKQQRGDKIRSAGAMLADMLANPGKYVTPEDMPDLTKEATVKAKKKVARVAEDERIAGLAAQMQRLYTRMQEEEGETFAAFLSHVEEKRTAFTRLPMFQSRRPDLQRAMLGAYDEEKGRIRMFLDYFQEQDCPLPELMEWIGGTREADIKRALEHFTQPK